MRFDPAEFWGHEAPKLNRPMFLAIISSNTLATTMLRRATTGGWIRYRRTDRRRA